MKSRGLAWAVAALIAVPALGLAAIAFDPTGFPFWRGGEYSDLLVSHWPMAAFIRQSLTEWRQLPLWNPLILSGMPLTADPLSGFWYAPNVVCWFSPSGLGFNLLFWAHLGFAAAGVMLLLRGEGASAAASLLGAMAFAATPKLIGHVGLGHLTLVEAASWTPWVLLAIRRAIDGGLEARGSLSRFGIAGAVLGLTFLIDPRWLIPAALLSIAYAGKCLAHSQSRRCRISIGRALTAGLLGLGVAAPALLPLLELMPRTTRWGMGAGEAEAISLPPARLLGALLFDGGGWPETQTYLGATVVLLLVVGAAASLRRGRFWTATLVVCLLLALGSYTPLYGWLARVIPGMGSLRVPARFYLLTALAAGMLAGHALDRLREVASEARSLRRVRLAAAGMGALAMTLPLLALAMRTPGAGDALRLSLLAAAAGGILAAVAAGCACRLARGAGTARVASAVLLTAVALDLGIANASTLRVVPSEAALSTEPCGPAGDSAEFGMRRVFSPSYSIPQQAAAQCRLELADGVNPLQLTAYRDAMASAAGFSTEAYSVTLPPFQDGDVSVNWHPVVDAGILGLFNVDTIVSAYPLESDDLQLLEARSGSWTYRNTLARPRAWVEPTGAVGAGWKPASELEWTPNRIRIRAEGPGRLVLSEIAYPGWRARVDGRPASIEATAGLLRSVEFGPGEHETVFAFAPASTGWGAGIGALALAVLAALKAIRR